MVPMGSQNGKIRKFFVLRSGKKLNSRDILGLSLAFALHKASLRLYCKLHDGSRVVYSIAAKEPASRYLKSSQNSGSRRRGSIKTHSILVTHGSVKGILIQLPGHHNLPVIVHKNKIQLVTVVVRGRKAIKGESDLRGLA